ncbi:Bax inhibitor-1/YccA family protein [Catenisphaera adipataccumulans]|jgi:FtsH-binding integral membrane protein|uniref:BAX inhibitor (BI)-1/YccA family protein n=1 Tax=Catenisphaera adipataccumulans TaxID=700500 RepID=A0A7W8CXY8_9FIRM|nr:Bax inhibitor-1/YccA family protein [Catenisphaera adipataccumulans]MBB5183672.1 hypothetical protein [Catenisphaera adipataccumulans]
MSQITNYFSQDDTHQALLSMYSWLGIGLLVTAVTSAVMYSSGAFITMLAMAPSMAWILALVQIGVVVAFSALINRASASTLKVLYIVYALTLGVSLTSLCYVYDLGSIAIAFLVSAVYYGSLVVIGHTTKRNLAGIGTLCLGALVALIICEIVMMIFGVSASTQLLSIIGLLIFTGLTAYDVQRAERLLSLPDGTMISREKMTIYMALELYLDFINIFLYILRIIGRNRD